MSLEWALNSNFDIINIINYAQYRGIYIYIVGMDRKKGEFFLFFFGVDRKVCVGRGASFRSGLEGVASFQNCQAQKKIIKKDYSNNALI